MGGYQGDEMSTLDFNPFIDKILAAERGYVNHSNDRGGPTNFGITQATAKANGFHGDMKDLPVALAREIYLKRYITEPRFDEIAELNAKIGGELIDTGVNMGPARAAEFFQRWLNGFNQQGSRYADLFVDGRIGDVTLDAFMSFLAWRGEDGVKALYRGLNCSQGSRYLDLAEDNPSQESFLYGWILNRVD